MKKILIHTLVTVLIFIGVILFFLLPHNGGMALLIALIALFAAPFPTYISILIYRGLQKKLFTHNKILSSIASVSILLAIYHLFLLAYLYFDSTYMMETFTKDYAYNIPAYLIAISIPIAELVIDKVERDMKQAQ